MHAPLPSSTRRFLLPALMLTASLWSLSAQAMIAPVRMVDDTHFVAASAELKATWVSLIIEPETMVQAPNLWWIDAEVRIRNIAEGPVSLPVAVIDDRSASNATRVWVNGQRRPSVAIEPHAMPGNPAQTYAHARKIMLDLAPGEEVAVRIRVRKPAVIDTVGRTHLELPTQALGLFADTVSAGNIELHADTRLVAMQSTIGTPVVYDGPLSEARWVVRQWEPGIPLHISFWTPWAALLTLAEAEACPPPWQVVQSVTQSEIGGVRQILARFDEQTLHFCSGLPEMLRGRPYSSERTREQLGTMTLARYVPGSEPIPLYSPASDYEESWLSEPEAIYSRILRAVHAERTANSATSPE